ncbi:MAG: winged helix-turn-helix domain-containing tetratricopeptide repeat protein [Myxococcota bacterium]
MTYQFERFTLDLDRCELSDGEKVVHLEPQAFDLMVYLVENQDRVLPKAEILDEIWQGRIVSESALTSRIKSIRRALDDDGKQQRLIRNYPSRGYRFMGELLQRPSDSEEASTTAPASTAAAAAVATGSTAGVAADGASAPAVAQRSPSLGILQFQVFGGEDKELSAIADNFVENLTTLVTRIPLLSIASRISAFSLDHKAVNAREAGERLGVRYILEGSFQRTQGAKSTLRVNAQLIDALSGFHLWAEKFDQAADDEDGERLLLELAARLELHLVHAIHQSMLAEGDELSAAELLVQASTLLAIEGWHRETFEEAADLLRRSIALDPNHALAHAELGLCLALGHRVGLLDRSSALVNEVIAENERALSFGRMDSNVLGRVGCAFADVGEVDRALPILRRALDLNPNNGQAWAALGATYQVLGEHGNAIEPLQKGIENSSIDSRRAVWKTTLALSYAGTGRLEEAVESVEEACQNDDKLYLSRLALALIRLLLKDPEAARKALEETLRVKPDLSRYEIACMVGASAASTLVDLLDPPRPDLK